MTDFGFRQVDRQEKAGLVHDVFAQVAPKYDLMNDVMSLGIHRLWKRIFLAQTRMRPGMKILDVAGGTGDIAFGWVKKGADDVTICDINPAMLAQGKKRAVDQGILSGLSWITGDAEKLPMEDLTYDLYSIAFGLRNVTDKKAALHEAHRVLKPGGKFMCLEFSHVVVPGLDQMYDAYSFHVVPVMGKLFAKNKDAYQYLVESIRQFPAQEELKQMMQEAGFHRVTHRNLSGGIVAIHTGYKL